MLSSARRPLRVKLRNSDIETGVFWGFIFVSWDYRGARGVYHGDEWLISAIYFPEDPVDEVSVTRYTNNICNCR